MGKYLYFGNASLFLLLSLIQTNAIAQSWEIAREADRCPSKWGADDERGSANMVTPTSVLNALQVVKTGEIYELGEVLTTDPEESYINRGRVFNIYTKPVVPVEGRRVSSEELVVTELGQVGTQLDGFTHQMYGESFYNCFKYKDIVTRSGYQKLGIENVGSIISRGILIDIAGYKGVNMVAQDYVITVADIRQALARQNTKIQSGDAVIINTGWGKNRGVNNENYGTNTPGIGIEAGLWIVEQQPVLVGTDTCCVEFRSPENRRLDVHSLMLIEKGIYMIENMNLEKLANDKVFEFLFVVQPLKLKGATGSAVAPIAIR
jgi:kynurenine formamidase